MCDASDIIDYDRGTSELPNASLHMKKEVNSTEKYTLKHQSWTSTYLLPRQHHLVSLQFHFRTLLGQDVLVLAADLLLHLAETLVQTHALPLGALEELCG